MLLQPKINWRHFTFFGGMNTNPAANLRAAGAPTPRSCPPDAGLHLHSEMCISRPTVRGIRGQRRGTAFDRDRKKKRLSSSRIHCRRRCAAAAWQNGYSSPQPAERMSSATACAAMCMYAVVALHEALRTIGRMGNTNAQHHTG